MPDGQDTVTVLDRLCNGTTPLRLSQRLCASCLVRILYRFTAAAGVPWGSMLRERGHAPLVPPSIRQRSPDDRMASWLGCRVCYSVISSEPSWLAWHRDAPRELVGNYM
jgi:hypothetical protein